MKWAQKVVSMRIWERARESLRALEHLVWLLFAGPARAPASQPARKAAASLSANTARFGQLVQRSSRDHLRGP